MAASQPAWPPPTTIKSKCSVQGSLREVQLAMAHVPINLGLMIGAVAPIKVTLFTDPAMRRVPFLSKPDCIVSGRDSQSFAETLNLMLRVRDCDPLHSSAGFWSETGVVPLGQEFLDRDLGCGIHLAGRVPPGRSGHPQNNRLCH